MSQLELVDLDSLVSSTHPYRRFHTYLPDATEAVADAIGKAGGFDAVVKAGRKAAATVKPRASKADPKPAPKAEAKAEAKADPAVYLHDAIGVAMKAAGGNRAMLELLASAMEDAAKGIRVALDAKPAPVGKAKRKAVAAA